jgi:NADPH:quinone reductase-like Zn-dependent oxidoreductase
MRAAVYEKYGPPEVVHLAEVPRPVPKDNEILIRVRAATVSAADWRARSLELPPGFGPMGRFVFGIFRPRRPILGTDLAGEVEAVGAKVTRFRPGAAVFAYPGLSMATHAEYRVMPEDGLIAPKPPNVSFAEAAALLFGGIAALDFFRRGGTPKPGETMLVNGASGAVGSAMVQLARHFGATVTAVTSTGNLDLVRSLGAAKVIDYTREDFTRRGDKYDILADTVGNVPVARARGSVKEGGRLFLVAGNLTDTVGAFVRPRRGGIRITAGTGAAKPEDITLLAEVAAQGRFKPVIDRIYPLAEIVAAHRHVAGRHKRGNVVVTMD